MAITLIFIDDHPLLLEGLEQLLGLEPDFEVLAKCRTGAAGLRAVESLHPDVVLLDLKLPDEDGFDVLRRLHAHDSLAVIVLTASEDEEDLLEAVRLGARGVVLKAMASKTVEHCIRVVAAGGEWLTVGQRDLAKRLAQRQLAELKFAERLTPREREIVRLLANQVENAEIARRLALSPGTVKIHIHHIYQKLGVRGRADLLRYLKQKGY